MVEREEADGFGTYDAMKIAGGGLFFIGSALTWWQIDFGGGLRVRANAFDYLVTGIIPFVIILAIALLTLLERTRSLRLPAVVLDPMVHVIAAGLATLLVGWRFVFSDWEAVGNTSVTRGPGIYVAVVAALLVLAGSILTVRELGAAVDEDEGSVPIDDQTPNRTPHPPLP